MPNFIIGRHVLVVMTQFEGLEIAALIEYKMNLKSRHAGD
jgi:hypothetical protein